MTDRVAISVQDIYKSFLLPHERPSGLKQALIKFRPGKSYTRQKVLRGVSFEVKSGEFFGIVGRNGGGKSTLLKLLAQIYQPDTGAIGINGTLTPFIELGVGFNPELTGRENVYLNGALLGFDRRQMNGMYNDIVEFAELEPFMDAKLKNYSSGMQVRLAFSVAIRVRSDILLLDEVLAVGDAAFQRKCYDYFMELKRKQATVVLVTHDMGAIRRYCDRAILVENGLIMKAGDPETIAQDYQKLFTDQSDGAAEEDGGDRWGDGKVRSRHTQVKVSNSAIHLETVYEVISPVRTLVAGFTVHGPSGLNILEGNTLRERLPLGPLKAGDKLTLNWEIPNIFASGRYNISVAACDKSTTEFYDWLNRAAVFNIDKPEATAGIVSPQIKLLSHSSTR